MKTPVVFIIFNRVDTSEKVFEAIRQAKPPKLFVIADAPRPEIPEDAEKCAITRSIIDQVDWECEVLKNYSETNLGPVKCISSGIDWVFNHVESAIILEHDCLPNLTFFDFCEELLEKYKYDTRVMHITGTNFGISGINKQDSYYFSRRTDIWGWATWKRAWNYYDVNMSLLPDFIKSGQLKNLSTSNKDYNKKLQRWEYHYTHSIKKTWDIQWHFACMSQGSYSIVPNKNLVRNIGFGEQALNTTYTESRFAKLELEEMEFPLRHPKFFIRDTYADDMYVKQRQWEESKRIDKRIHRKLKKWLKIN